MICKEDFARRTRVAGICDTNYFTELFILKYFSTLMKKKSLQL
jgi:hypothetical protein